MMANLIKAREWARSTVVVGGSRVSTTLKLMNIHAERRRECPLDISIVELSQRMEQEKIIDKVAKAVRNRNAKLIIYMVEWGFNSEQGYHSGNSRETLKKIVELEMRLCRHTHSAAVRNDVTFLLYPGVTDIGKENSILGQSSKVLNDYTVAWLRERGINWNIYWPNVTGDVRDKEGNIPPIMFKESFAQVLHYVQARNKTFLTAPRQNVANNIFSPSASNMPAIIPMVRTATTCTQTSPSAVSEPWIQGDHSSCYSKIRKLENEIACLHVQVAQQLERSRAADARREEAEGRCRDLIRIQEQLVTEQRKDGRGRWGNENASYDVTGTWENHGAQSESPPLTPRDVTDKCRSPIEEQENQTNNTPASRAATPCLQDLMEEEDLLLGDDMQFPEGVGAEEEVMGAGSISGRGGSVSPN